VNDHEPAGEGRVALVTGGSGAIGQAICRDLVRSGFRVATTFNSTAPERNEASERFLPIPCDLRDADQIDALVDTVERDLGRIDVFVGNAGMTRDRLISQMRPEDFDDILAVNLTANHRLVRRLSRPMIRNRYGRIVLITSVTGLMGAPGQTNYAAAKSGLIGLGRSLARELATRDITVNMIAPGPIESPMFAEVGAKRRDEIIQLVPVHRVGAPEDVARAVSFFAAEQAGFLTGAVLPVDGGLSMGI
jgi:3-oxoacyl-[acyl-carrier protein] reductase